MSTDEVDALLEHYLYLLDQYTSLQSELGTLQSSIHQDIARANFTSDRGLRYGQDHYDQRMRAMRTIQITSLPPTSSSNNPSTPIFTTTTNATAKTVETTDPTSSPPVTKNPLTMFGILVPPSLRSAQESAIMLVSNIIPQLASVDAEMREVEICIRRARKKIQQQQHRKRKAEQQMSRRRSQSDLSREAAVLAMATATQDGPTPKGILREGPAPPYVEVRFAEEVNEVFAND